MTTSKKTRSKIKKNINSKGHIIEDEEDIDFSSNGTFDVQKYTLGNQTREVTIYVGADKDELSLTIKDMSWSRRNRVMSDCLTWDQTGNTSFDGDAYVRLCLKEMIKSAPWGNTTEAFLIRINDELGQALEALVPRAFANNTEVDGDINAIKKGQ
tara:strand:- start:835 stop:1299 length:465 start_codon:yes stop_codon:yes gene_type:complete